MNVAELADELGLDSAAVLRLCRDRGIRASWDESELSDDAVARVRQALAGGSIEGSAEPDIEPVLTAVGAGSVAGDPAGPSPAPAGRMAAVPTDGSVPVQQAPLGPRETTAEVAIGFKVLAGAAVAAAGWWGLRYLPHWNQGRWWMLAIALAVVAGICALRALTLGVEGFFNVLQSPIARRGKPEAGVITALSSILLVFVVLLGVYDWTAIRLPDAYNRLRHSIDRETDANSGTLNRLGGTDVGTVLDPGGADVAGLQAGQCIMFDVGEGLASNVVPCSRTHSHEVVGFSQFSSPEYPGRSVLALQAKQRCEGPFVAYVGRPSGESRYRLIATYPFESQWASGIRRGACLATPPKSEAGTARGANR